MVNPPATDSVSEPDLNLTSYGSITGRILLDNNQNSNLEFLVCADGTSYMAMTDNNGNFTISDIPAGSGYVILVMRGNYTDIWSSIGATDTGERTATLSSKAVNSSKINTEGSGLQWKGELDDDPENPEKNWAQYNKGNGTSYVYNGQGWDVLAAPGKDGTSGSVVTIDGDGYWYIDGVKTDTKVDRSEVAIGANSNWFIDGVGTRKPDRGEQGEDVYLVVFNTAGGSFTGGEAVNVISTSGSIITPPETIPP